MKIATWNVERLKHKADLDKMISACRSVAADILVLTETDQRLHPDYRFCYATPTLTQQPINYAPSENRVSIYTNYPCVRQHRTYDADTSICVELETECGNVLVYGTIIGIYGNRHPPSMKTSEDKLTMFPGSPDLETDSSFAETLIVALRTITISRSSEEVFS